MTQKWYKGHIGRFWNEDYKNFPWVRQPLMQYEIDEWIRKGYDYVKSFSGKMYDSRNPMPDWIDTFKNGMLDYKNLTFTFYKMETLEIMPEHVDHFNTYARLFNVEKNEIVRILVMLEDWKPGHYLEVDGVGIVNWLAGDYFVWENDIPHAAANIGVDPRYTLQITGTKINSKDAWNKLHWYNIPKLKTKIESKNDPFLYYLRHYLNNTEDPYYIYMLNQEITELNDIIHDEETINYLNQTGLTFYLYEPLCSYNESEKDIPGYFTDNITFYKEFSSTIDVNDLRANELDSILEYANRNNLNNITVKSCDYNIEKYYPYYTNKLKLRCDDLFVKTCRPVRKSTHDYNFEFTKKFISPNWRYTPHRHLIAAYVSTLDSIFSWYYKADLPSLATSVWYDLYEWNNDSNKQKYFSKILQGLQNLNNNSPINLDLKIEEPILLSSNKKLAPMPNYEQINDKLNEIIDTTNNALEDFYKDVFCDVVTESRFAQPTGNYSEKVHFPMWYKKPFVLVAPPHTLKYLREEGYKTFNDFWDESYDEIENHEERLLKIFDVLEEINQKSIEELREIYKEMIPILDHNFDLIFNRLSRNDVI